MKMRSLFVLLVGAAVLAPAASASTVVGHPPRIAGATNSTSTNWAGYAATGGTYHSVSASWTEPSVDCSAGGTSYSSFWVGLDGYSSNTVEQIGTDADCQNGTPTYYAWYEMYPKLSGQLVTISPGDSISASVVAGGDGTFTLTLAVNGGTPLTITGRDRHAALSSAEVITEAPSSNHGPHGTLPLASFGTVTFSGATVDGEGLESTDPEEITMQQGSTVRAQPSPLKHGGFSVTWEHA